MVREIVWDKAAILQLEEIYRYLWERSPQAAGKVTRSIKEATRKLGRYPEAHNWEDIPKLIMWIGLK